MPRRPTSAGKKRAPQAPEHVGALVAKVFPGYGLFVGEVIEYRPDPREGDLWRIRYEDGELEDVLEEDMLECKQLHQDCKEEIARLKSVRLFRKPAVARAPVAAPPAPAPIAAPPPPASRRRMVEVEEDEEDEDEEEEQQEPQQLQLPAVVTRGESSNAGARDAGSSRAAAATVRRDENEPEAGGGAGGGVMVDEGEHEDEDTLSAGDNEEGGPRKRGRRKREDARGRKRPTQAPRQCPDCLTTLTGPGFKYHMENGPVCHKRPLKFFEPPDGVICPICKGRTATNAALLYHLKNSSCWPDWSRLHTPAAQQQQQQRQPSSRQGPPAPSAATTSSVASAAECPSSPGSTIDDDTVTTVSAGRSLKERKTMRRKAGIQVMLPDIGGLLDAKSLFKGQQPPVEGAPPLGDLTFYRQLVEDASRRRRVQRLPLSSWMQDNAIKVAPINARVTVPRQASPSIFKIRPFQAVSVAGNVLLNACGPIYGLDYLVHQQSRTSRTAPTAGHGRKRKQRQEDEEGGSGTTLLYVAVGVSTLAPGASTASDFDLASGAPGAPRLHQVGEKVTAPNLVQIWRVGLTPSGGSNSKMVFGIGHKFGPVWDMRWAPTNATLGINWAPSGGAVDALGVLAVVMGDGQLRVYAVPREERAGRGGEGMDEDEEEEEAEPSVLADLEPVCLSRTTGGLHFTVVRWSPCDPARLICGAADGSVLMYRIEADSCAITPGDDERRQPQGRLVPVLRFFDVKSAGNFACTAVTSLSWCPADPDCFAAAGRETAVRVWHVTEPFCPLVEKGTCRASKSITWLPSGMACLSGMGTGEVRIVGFPEDLCKVRFYMHDSEGCDPVNCLDSCVLWQDSSSDYDDTIVIASAGGDGQLRLTYLDEDDLIRSRYRDRGSRMTINMALTVIDDEDYEDDDDEDSAAGARRQEGRRRLGVNLRSRPAPAAERLTGGKGDDEGKSGKLLHTMRASLTTVRCMPAAVGAGAVVGVGGFSGLARFVLV